MVRRTHEDLAGPSMPDPTDVESDLLRTGLTEPTADAETPLPAPAPGGQLSTMADLPVLVFFFLSLSFLGRVGMVVRWAAAVEVAADMDPAGAAGPLANVDELVEVAMLPPVVAPATAVKSC